MRLLLWVRLFCGWRARVGFSFVCIYSHTHAHPCTHTPVAPSCARHTAALRLEKDALLDLLGEKDEELEALRSDLEDVKEAFRVQVDLLLERLVASGGGSQLAAVQQQ